MASYDIPGTTHMLHILWVSKLFHMLFHTLNNSEKSIEETSFSFFIDDEAWKILTDIPQAEN